MAPVDRFRIISKLGAGGCGEAFRAWDNQDGVPVVLKRPLAEHLRSPAMLERFDREIKRLSGLVHQHIVPIVDHGHDAKGLPYLAMRFLPAGSLADRQKPQAVSYLRFWLPSVAAALDYVHARGVVHRDVKPANIFFDTHFKAYLGDFGIAKVIDEELAEASEHSLTSTGGEIGTYPYMAPEFFRKPRVLSGAYDQYALAITVYEMICGQRPFTGDSGQLIFAHATQNPPDIRETVSDAPDSLCEAVHQALAKKPVDRFDSCAAFADAALRDVAAVPLNDALRYFLCPACMKLVRVPTDAGGKSCRCTRCNAALRISQNIDALWREEEAPSTFRSPQRQANRSDKESPARSPSGSGRITAHTSQDGAFRQLTQAEESRQANEQLTTSQTTAPKTAVRAAWKVSPAVIGIGLAVALLTAVVIWRPLPGPQPKPVRPPPSSAWPRALTYYERLADAKSRLHLDSKDQSANHIVGTHWCFNQQDWQKGLPYLAQSGEVGVAAAAEKELAARNASPARPGDWLRAAHCWWTLVGQQLATTDAMSEAIRNHATSLYLAQVGLVRAESDVAFANAWLDSDKVFRELVGNKRPSSGSTAHDAPPPSVTDARNILTQPPIVNSIGMKLKLIPAGTFQMGDDRGRPDERPAHEVTITKPFYLGVYEVTNTQWKKVMPNIDTYSPWDCSEMQEGDRPVLHVSWGRTTEFCRLLSAVPEEVKAGRVYRLPTEAEWEYACRAGTRTEFSFGNDNYLLGDYGWFGGNAGGQTHPVGQKKPNPWGLYDMHGNVWELCSDWFGSYSKDKVLDPQGAPEGPDGVFRGGGLASHAETCSSTTRGTGSVRNKFVGFRLVMNLASP